ncbi:hypothetical protein FOL47_001892 [Perkinsus chesapeaki]|uniref:Reverse transcriptase n=1 Tax=Perkinsus chesapeaki TaxID=330153 RepID=A0A7J6MHF7_PERCH|nr:hypothetical protein FOL47_001892 [Perkinsus chesapeaki]
MDCYHDTREEEDRAYGASSEKHLDYSRFSFLDEVIMDAEVNARPEDVDYLAEKSLRRLEDPHQAVITLLGYGQFAPYNQTKGLGLLLPSGKQVYSFEAFCKGWGIHKTADWTEANWQKVQSCARLSRLASPLTLMLLSYVTPSTISRRVLECCLARHGSLVAWHLIEVAEEGEKDQEDTMVDQVSKWLSSCNEVLQDAIERATEEFKVQDTSEALRRWCNLFPKSWQAWSDFLARERMVYAQLEDVDFTGTSWHIRCDKLLKALSVYPYFKNQVARAQEFPILKKTKKIHEFIALLEDLAQRHSPASLDAVLGILGDQSRNGGGKPSHSGKTGGSKNGAQITKDTIVKTEESASASVVTQSGGVGPSADVKRGARNSKSKAAGACFGCGEQGHMKRDCPRRKSVAVKEEKGEGGGQKVTRSGHTYILSHEYSDKDSCVDTLEFTDQNGAVQQLRACFDTGSTINLCSSEACAKLRADIISLGDDGMVAQSLGGPVKLARMAELCIYGQDQSVDVAFYVPDDGSFEDGFSKFDVLVGRPTLEKLGYKLVRISAEVCQTTDGTQSAEDLVEVPPAEDLQVLWGEGLTTDSFHYYSRYPSRKDFVLDPQVSLDTLVERGVAYLTTHYADWTRIPGNKWYMFRIRPIDEAGGDIRDCPGQTHVFEFDWQEDNENHPRARQFDYSTHLISKLDDDQRQYFAGEINEYLKRRWWVPEEDAAVLGTCGNGDEGGVDRQTPRESIVIFPVVSQSASTRIRPCADARGRNRDLPPSGYYDLPIADCALTLLSYPSAYLQYKDISKAFYRLTVRRSKALSLTINNQKFLTRRIAFGVRFGPLALSCFTTALIHSIYSALLNTECPDLLPEERATYIRGLTLLVYFDDFMVSAEDPVVGNLVSELLSRVGERVAAEFPDAKADRILDVPKKHIGLNWYFKNGNLCASCPTVDPRLWKIGDTVSKRQLFRLCGLAPDPLCQHPVRSLIFDSLRSWSGSYGLATDRASWDEPLPIGEEGRKRLEELFDRVRDLSKPCEHVSWADVTELYGYSDACESGFGWTIQTPDGRVVLEQCKTFPAGLRWHTNRRELFAVVSLIKALARITSIAHHITSVRVFCDNTSTVSWCDTHLHHLKGYDKLAVRKMLQQFSEAEAAMKERGIAVRTSHIKGKENGQADELSRCTADLKLPEPLPPRQKAVFLIQGTTEGLGVKTPIFRDRCAQALTTDDSRWRGVQLRRFLKPEAERTDAERGLSWCLTIGEDGCLYFIDADKRARLYVPHQPRTPWEKTLRAQVLGAAHWHHSTATGMLARVQEECWWPNLRREVTDFCQRCLSCRREALRVVPLTGQRPRAIRSRFESVVVDFLGPFNGITVDTTQGIIQNPCILVMVDTFSTWLELRITPDQTAASTVDGLIAWSMRYGVPRHVQSDRGAGFASSVLAGVMRAFNIDHVMGAGYHPQPQGEAERAVGFVKAGLRRLTANIPLAIAFKYLGFISRLHNTSPRYGGPVTPEELLYGGRTRDGLQSLLEGGADADAPESTVDAAEYLDKLKEELGSLQMVWKHFIAEARVSNLDGGPVRHEQPVQVGDKVFRIIVDGLHKRQVLGPFVVEKIDGSMASLKGGGGAPCWQLWQAPSSEMVRRFGDLGIPDLQGLKQVLPENLCEGDLIAYRSPVDDPESVVCIDLGRVVKNNVFDEMLSVQRLVVDDEGKWYDTQGDAQHLVIIDYNDLVCSGPKVALTQQGYLRAGLKKMFQQLGVPV